MAQAKASKNVQSVQKIAKYILNQAGRMLFHIGRPFYYLLSSAGFVIGLILYITGHTTILIFQMVFLEIINTLHILQRIFRSTKKTLKGQKVPKPKIKLHIPQLQVKRITTKIIQPKKILSGTISLFLLEVKVSILKLFSLKERVILLIVKVVNYLNVAISILYTTFGTVTKKISLRHISLPRLKFKYIYLVIGIFSLLLIVTPILLGLYTLHGLPSPEDLINRKVDLSTKIYDRNGILLYTIYKDKNRTIIPMEEVPTVVKYATLAAEDAEFYSHPGISFRGMARALYKNITEGELSGGSTITQQLVKNALLTTEKTYSRKVREVVLSFMVESNYTKDEILEMYLNEVSYGGTAYGIREASYMYFDKEVNKLSLAEAAVLAGLPKSPTKYSPFGNEPETAIARQKDVLHLMQTNGYITKKQEEKALSQEIKFSENKTAIKAPHFVMYTRQLLEEKYPSDVVEKGGLVVVTSLDYGIQKLAENVVKEEIDKLKDLNVTNAAVIVLEPKTGHILAMVGSKDYFDISNDGNVNLTTAPRQPGSSIKVVNYANALSNGHTPATIIADTPITYNVLGQPPYTPRNYDSTYRGHLSLRSALAESRNIPAVKVLSTFGVKNMIQTGKNMGITTWEDKNRFGLSLTLGGGEVKLIDLAQVYATLANYGARPELIAVTKITDSTGKEVYTDSCMENEPEFSFPENKLIQIVKPIDASVTEEGKCSLNQVVDPRVAFTITNILHDNEARSPAFGSISELVISNHPEVAVKTGTSNDLKDNLTIGYTKDYVVAVWVGNNDNSPMSRVASGVTGASPIFNKVMSALLVNYDPYDWYIPENMVRVKTCTLTGTLPCSGCPTREEWFLIENAPKRSCNPDFIEQLKENNKVTKRQDYTQPLN